MTENSDPRENPQAERIHETIKDEIFYECEFHSMFEAEEAVKSAVNFYNNERPHMSIGMMTPSEASGSNGERDMRWTSYRELAIKQSIEAKNAENGLPLSSCNRSPCGQHPQSTNNRDKTWEVNRSQE